MSVISQIATARRLTDGEYAALKRVVPHGVPVELPTWAVFLGLALGREVTVSDARELIAAYNARMSEEYAQ